MNILRALLLSLILTATLIAPAQAKKPGETRTLLLYLENDSFADSDRHYTNAVKVTLMSRDLRELSEDENLPEAFADYLERLPLMSDADHIYNVSLSLGHEIYTPSDTDATEVVEDDRPYAGWLYGTLGLHRKDETLLDSLELTVGIVGPSALGEQVQNNWHEFIGIDTSKGWDNQLKDELGIVLGYQRHWRAFRLDDPRGGGFEILPHGGGALGNVHTYANAGLELRYGYNIPYDFGTSQIRSIGGVNAPVSEKDVRLQRTRSFSCYVFGGFDSKFVARNIFIDGNTFQNSHSVNRKPFVTDVFGGVAVVVGRVQLTYTQVLRTKEYAGQEGSHSFGSLNLGVTF